MQLADLTTVELQRLGCALVRAYLDATAGGRPDALRRWLGGTQPTTNTPPDTQIGHAHIGPVTVLRQARDRVYVAAAVTSSDAAPPALVAAELTSDGRSLRATRIGHFPPVPDIDGPGWALDPEPPQHLTRLLGPVPYSSEACGRWATAAAIVAEYREAWGIDDPHFALGPQSGDAEQRAERERAVAATRELVQAIDHAEPERHATGRELHGPGLER